MGRFTINSEEFLIQKETDKTIIVTKTHGAHRYQKSDMLKIHADFKNTAINRLQFFTFCLSKDKAEAEKLLYLAIKNKAEELASINDMAWEAFLKGPKST